MNAEHTWPQSRGAIAGSARSDLHHIFPVSSLVNSLRGSSPFCDVVDVIREIGPARLGYDSGGRRCFEPRGLHRGNVARAMFYFSVVYQQDISEEEEAVLRRWHDEDPVNDAEVRRMEAVSYLQGSINPFVQRSELVDRISDF
jgi:deoxyribonuclease I